MGAQVKPLQWNPFRADTPFGCYYIDDQRDRSDLKGRPPFLLYGSRIDLARYPTLDAARAAAQADYDQRILSALAPTPTVPAGMVEPEVYWKEQYDIAQEQLLAAKAIVERLEGETANLRKEKGKLHDYANMRDVQIVTAEAQLAAMREALEAALETLTADDACNIAPIVGSNNPHEHAAGLVQRAMIQAAKDTR